jgi:hypothetical protein
MTDAPKGGWAHFDLLLAGSLTSTAGRVAATCSLVRDDGRIIVPGHAAPFAEPSTLRQLSSRRGC